MGNILQLCQNDWIGSCPSEIQNISVNTVDLDFITSILPTRNSAPFNLQLHKRKHIKRRKRRKKRTHPPTRIMHLLHRKIAASAPQYRVRVDTQVTSLSGWRKWSSLAMEADLTQSDG